MSPEQEQDFVEVAQEITDVLAELLASDVHPGVKHLLRFFKFDHLPQELQLVSHLFAMVAVTIAGSELPLKGPELTVALRKLLEAKDAAVRAAL